MVGREQTECRWQYGSDPNRSRKSPCQLNHPCNTRGVSERDLKKEVPDPPGRGPALRYRPPASGTQGRGPGRRAGRVPPRGGTARGLRGAVRPGPRASRPPGGSYSPFAAGDAADQNSTVVDHEHPPWTATWRGIETSLRRLAKTLHWGPHQFPAVAFPKPSTMRRSYSRWWHGLSIVLVRRDVVGPT